MSTIVIRNALQKVGALRLARRTGDAWKLCERLYSKFPKDKSVVVALVDLEESLGRYKRSHRILKLMIKQSDGFVASEYKKLLGESYLASGFYWRSLRMFRELLKVDSDNSNLLYQLASILVRIERIERAFPYFEQALKQSPNSVDYLLAYAKAKYDVRLYEDALTLYQRAAQQVKSELKENIHLSIVLCYFQLEEKEKAVACLLSKPEGGSIDNDDVSLIEQKIKSFKVLGQGELVTYLCSFINQYRPSFDSLLTEAFVENEKGTYSRALKLIEQAEAMGGPSLQLDFYYAYYFSCIDDFDRALACINRCLDIHAESLEFLLLKATILDHGFDLEGALKIYGTILKIDAGHQQARWGCATIAFALGRWDEAFDHQCYRAFIALDKAGLNARFPYLKEWDGKENISSLLIVDEQGVGDHIRYAKFYQCLEDRVGSIHLVSDLRLEGLFCTNFTNMTLTQRHPTIPPHREVVESGVKYFIASADLGRLFHDEVFAEPLEDFTLAKLTGYLVPDRSKLKEMNKLVNANKASIYVGVCWRGPVYMEGRADWYVTAEQINALFKGIQDRVVLVSLQYKPTLKEMSELEGFGFADVVVPEIDLKDDFDGMSAVISTLDLVISPATAVCELAGALGIPVWMFATREMAK